MNSIGGINPKIIRVLALIVFIIMSSFNSIYSQLTKEVKRGTPGRDVKEVYSVLKTDNHIKHGDYRMTYLDNEITTGQYTYGKRTGTWAFKDVDGKVYYVGHYSEGLKDSLWIFFNENTLSSQLYFTRGRIDSVFGYYPDGQVAYVQRLNSLGTGHAFSFYPNGTVKESIPIHDNSMNGICIMGFENGRLFRRVLVKNNRIITVLETFDPDGKQIEGGTLKDGTGTYFRYYPDSMRAEEFNFSILATYKEGILQGKYRTYNFEGELIWAGEFENGQKNGYWNKYNDYGLEDSVLFRPNPRYNSTFNDTLFERQIGYFVPELMSEPNSFPSFQFGIDGMHNFIYANRIYPLPWTRSTWRQVNLAPTLGYRIPVVLYIDFNGEIIDSELFQNLTTSPWEDRQVMEGMWIFDPIIERSGWIPKYKIWEIDEKSPIRTKYSNEALRLIQTMPRWTPAFQNYIPISYPVGVVF